MWFRSCEYNRKGTFETAPHSNQSAKKKNATDQWRLTFLSKPACIECIALVGIAGFISFFEPTHALF
jgi:hypothetical protein